MNEPGIIYFYYYFLFLFDNRACGLEILIITTLEVHSDSTVLVRQYQPSAC